MKNTDLDKLHDKRLDALVKRWHEGDDVDINDIFVSELVINSLDNEKTLIESFDLPNILALLPFTEIIYVEICPYCITKSNFEAFKSLTISGLIIPVLNGPYHAYPDPVIDVLKGHNHVSWHEYLLFKSTILPHLADGGLCRHCVDKREDELKALVKGKRKAPIYRENLDRLMYNISPFVPPDFELLDEIEVAFKTLDIDRVIQLRDMSEAINSFRNAQAFNAVLSFNEKDISNIPPGITDESDDARRVALELNGMVSDGLGLKIPTDINIDQYIELLKDFRPDILQITNTIMDSSNIEGDLSVKQLLGTISSINTEIERIKGLKRYMLYEAGVEFVGNNKTFVASAFIASAMGLAGSLTGCIGVAAAGAAVNQAKRKGKLKTGKSIGKLGTKIHRDLQPNIDHLIAKYIGTEVPAMRVLSIRKALDDQKS